MDKLLINEDDTELNVDYYELDIQTWLNEKPLSVLSLDHADRAVLKIADQRDKIQKKTFTKWINKYLKQVSIEIFDLFEDLKDGNNLLKLLEILSNKKLLRQKGTYRIHAIQNIQSCLDFLRQHDIRLVNIRSDEIVDGNPKLTLGLIWIIILHFQVSEITSHELGKNLSAKDALMYWVQKHLDGYNGIQVRDFSHSWSDGKAFIAIMHRHKPDKIELDKMHKRGNKENLQFAFDFAEKELNVTKLLDPEDVDVLTPDEKSIITYVSSLYDAIPTIPIHPNQIHRDKEKRGLLQDYTHVAKCHIKWLNDSIDMMTSKQFPNDFIELKSLIADLKSFRLEEYAQNAKDKRKLRHLHDELEAFEQQTPIDTCLDLSVINKLWEKLDASIHVREILLEKSIEKFENMQKNYDRLNIECKLLNENLNLLQEKINFCNEIINNSHLHGSANSELVTFERLETSIQSNDQQIRKLFTEARQLQDECFPNVDTLMSTIVHIQTRLIDMRVDLKHKSRTNSQESLRTLSRSKSSLLLLDESNKDLIEWIRSKQEEINQITYKCDLSQLKEQIEILQRINNDVKCFSCKIESTLQNGTHRQDDFYKEFKNLCLSVKHKGLYLDALYELSKQFHGELKFLNELEDIELNRDWSQLNKLDLNDLIKYKSDTETKILQHNENINAFISNAQKLIASEHPASQDLQNCIITIENEAKWVSQLMSVLEKHLQSLRIYEQFYKNYEKIDRYLDDLNIKFDELKDYLSKNSRENSANCNAKITKFKKSFDQFTNTSFSDYFDTLYDQASRMPSYRCRQKSLKTPLNKCNIQTPFNLADLCIDEGDECLIEDNTNRVKWKVFVLSKNVRVEIPSVCFILSPSEQELLDQIDKLKIKYEGINDAINLEFIKIKTDKLVELMQIEMSEPKRLDSSNLDKMLDTFREEIDFISNRLINNQKSSPEVTHLINKLKSQFQIFQQKIHPKIKSTHDNQQIAILSVQTTITSFNNTTTTTAQNPLYTLDSIEMRIKNLFKNFYLLCDQVLFVHMRQSKSKIKKNDDLEKQLKMESDSLRFRLRMSNSTSSIIEHTIKSACVKSFNIEPNINFDLHLNPPLSLRGTLSQTRSRQRSSLLRHFSDLNSRRNKSPFTFIETVSIKRHGSLSPNKKKNFIESDLKKYENDMNVCEKSVHETSDNEFKQRFTRIKSKYHDLITLSSLYVENFKLLDELSLVMDEFACDLCKIENILSSPTMIHGDLDSLKEELDKLNNLEHLFKQHEQDLNEIQCIYNKLKYAVDRVRCESNVESKNTNESAEDIQKLSTIIEQLNDRWSRAFKLFSNRKSNLKQLLQTYKKYRQLLSTERNWPQIVRERISSQLLDIENNNTNNSSSANDSGIYSRIGNDEFLNQTFNEIIQKSTNIDELNKSAIAINQLAKNLNESNQHIVDLNDVDKLNSEIIQLLEIFKENVLKYQTQEENKIKTNQIDISLIDKQIETLNEHQMSLRDFCGTSYQHVISRSQSKTNQFFYSNENLLSTVDYPQCRVESSMSEYRLSLSDFIELNLIDESNGLIINPLNGQRLTLMEAIKLDLINSDIKEIANIYDSCNSKLTIKEAINLKLVNSSTNEFLLSNGSNSNLKLISFYEARERNLILKPLTLSEAFLLNLIDRNGYVKNPSNQNLIQFSCLFQKNPSCIDLFDMDTKHIIDLNRNNKKLLSINEAISTNLILPCTFEVCTSGGVRVNFYDAFHSKNCFNLILYKPEIDNIFVKLSFPHNIKLKRDKIGLIESLYLNIIDLNNELYINKYLNIKLSLTEAITKNLIDKELIDILNTSIGIQRNGVCLLVKDCIKDYSLYLEKYLFKNPFTSEYMHLDSFKCKKILDENKIRLIKRLITRINVKNYLVSFNNNSSCKNAFDLPVINVSKDRKLSNTSQDSYLHEIKTLTVESVKDAKTGQVFSINDAIRSGILDKHSLCYKNTKTGQIMSLNDAHEQGYVNGRFHNGSLATKNHQNSNKSMELIKTNDGRVVLAEKEELNYQISQVVDTETGHKLSLERAVKLGIIDKKSGTYVNRRTGARMNLNEAYNRGLIEAKPFKKESILKIDVGKSQQSDDSLFNDSVLCEINEIEETVALPLSASTKFQSHLLAASTPRSILGGEHNSNNTAMDETQVTSFHNSIQIDIEHSGTPNSSRVGQHIDENEEDVNDDYVTQQQQQSCIVSMNGNATTKPSSIRMRSKSSGKNIQERRMPSIYGSNQTLETLVIDDNRRSTSLNIEGETHVYKNEVSIESASDASIGRKCSSTVTPNDELTSAIKIKNGQEQISCISLLNKNSIDKKDESTLKRSTVIIVDGEKEKAKEDKLLLTTSDNGNQQTTYQQKQQPTEFNPPRIEKKTKIVKQSDGSKELLIEVKNEDNQSSPKVLSNCLENTSAECDGEKYQKELNKCAYEINEFELKLVKQSALSDRFQIFMTQKENFDTFETLILQQNQSTINIFSKCATYLNTGSNSLRENKLKSLLRSQLIELKDRHDNLNEHCATRRIKFDEAKIVLEKFYHECKKNQNIILDIDSNLQSIDLSFNQFSLDSTKFKELDGACSSLLRSIQSHLDESRILRGFYQNFAQISIAFNKDLQAFNTKIKSPFKCNDSNGDLNCLKENIREIEGTYEAQAQKCNTLSHEINNRIELVERTTVAIDKFDIWLTSLENQVKNEMEKFNVTLKSSRGHVTLFKDYLNIFENIKFDLCQNKKTLDEFTRFEPNERINHLNVRFNALEKAVSQYCDVFADKLQQTKNIHEKFDSMIIWLNEKERLFVSDNLVNEDLSEKLNSLELLKDELNRKREVIASKQNADLILKEVVDQAVTKFNKFIGKLDTRVVEINSLKSKIDDFSHKLSELNEYTQKCSSRYLEDNPLALRNELNIKVDGLNGLKSILKSINNQYSHIFNSNQMQKRLDQVEIQFVNYTNDLNARVAKFEAHNMLKNEYIELKSSIDKYVERMNASIKSFEPVAFELNTVESQYKQLDGLLSDYDANRHLFVKLNEIGAQFDTNDYLGSMNNSYKSMGKILESRKSDLLDSLEQLKSFLQELHLIDSRLNSLNDKFVKVFSYNETSSNGEHLPISRTILNQMTNLLKNIQNDYDSCFKDFQQLKYSNQKYTDMCEFKELFVKFSQQNELIKMRQDLVSVCIVNLDLFEQSRDQLKQNFDQKSKLISVFKASNQLSDASILSSHIDQIEAIKDSLINKDTQLVHNFNKTGQVLIKLSIKRDSELLEKELDTFEAKFDKLKNDCDELLIIKSRIKDLSLNFNDLKEQLCEDLSMIDSRLDAINVNLSSIKYDNAIKELDEIEVSFEAPNILKQLQGCLNELNTVQPIEELKQTFIQMTQAVSSTKCKLSITRDGLLNLQAKDVKINALIENINKFISDKTLALDTLEPFSCLSDKQNRLKASIQSLNGEIEVKREDLRRLVAEFDVKSSLKASEFNILHDNFNQLSKNITLKRDKLNDIVKMSDNFHKLFEYLTQFFDEMSRKLNKDKKFLNKRDLEHQLKDMDDLNANLQLKSKELTEFFHLGNEINGRIQIDDEYLNDLMDSMRKLYESIKYDASSHQQLLLEIHQRVNKYEDSVKDAKQALNEKDMIMNRLMYDCTINDNNSRNISEFRSIQDALQISIKPKLDLISDLVLSLHEDKNLDNLMESQIKRNVDDLSRLYDKMDKKIKEKLEEFEVNMSEIDVLAQDLKELFVNIDTVENFFKENNVKTLIHDEDYLRLQQSQFVQINQALTSIHEKYNGINENFKRLISKRAINWNDPLKEQLSLIAKNSSQLDLQAKLYEKDLNKVLQGVVEMQKKINDCNSKIANVLNDMDLSKPVPNAVEIINNFANEHRLSEHRLLDPLKHEVLSINQQANFILKDTKPHCVCSLQMHLNVLNENLEKLEIKFKAKGKQLELAHLKSTKFEKLIENLDGNLTKIDLSFQTLNKTLFKIQNIELIESHLTQYAEIQEYLSSQTPGLEDLRDLVEKLFDAGCSHDDQDQIEQRMNSTIEKWSQLTRSTDEKTANLNFINENLTTLKDNCVHIQASLDELEQRFSKNLVINCLEPIVIKSQYERMREINDALISHSELINETKELNESLLDDAQSSTMLDKNELESSMNQIDLKYSEFRGVLETNLDLIHRLYPLCEQFSNLVTCINESINKCDRDLDWLKLSSDDETTSKEKQNLIEEIQSNSFKTSQLMDQLEIELSQAIIDELNKSTIKSDEFIDDLNESLTQIKKKHQMLNESINAFVSEFIKRKNKSNEVLGELYDLQEWLDEVEVKLLNTKPISCSQDEIKVQIQEQTSLNQEIQAYGLKLKHYVTSIKKFIRDKTIEDSIELKEKLTSLQNQVNNLAKVSTQRTNDLEQTLAISINFGDVHSSIKAWFDQITRECNRLELKQVDKDSLTKVLSQVKQVDRELYDKKADIDHFNKNGKSLINLCGKTNQIESMLRVINSKYDELKDNIKSRKDELENLLWISAEFVDKVDNLAVNLNAIVETIEYIEPISAHTEKLEQQINENQSMMHELNKRRQALDNCALQSTSVDHSDELHDKLNELDTLWSQLRSIAEKRAEILDETLEYSKCFWKDYHSLADIISALEERIRQIENETVAMDPESVIEQQKNHEEIASEINDTETQVEQLKSTGSRLLTLCGKEDQSEIQKSLEDIDVSWDRVKSLVRERQAELQDTFGKACEFQQQLIEVLEWIGLQQEKFTNLDSNFTSNDAKTIRFQIELLQGFKTQVDPKQLDVQVLNQNFNELKSNMKSSQSFDVLEALQEPLNSANKEWKRLQSSIVERKSALQNALLSTGKFNDALDEMIKWLELTNEQLDNVQTDGLNEVKLLDIELAKLKVLQNDVRAQEQSVEKIKDTARNVIKNETTGKVSVTETKNKIHYLIKTWTGILEKSKVKQSQLNTRYYESQNFQSELQDTLLWLSEIENNLINSKPFGGLPETAKDQLNKFMINFNHLNANEAKIELLINTGLSLINEQNSGLCQVVDILRSRWSHVKKKAEERRDKLEAAYEEAVEFDSQLQKFIVWITNTEKTLNMLRPVSRVLDTVTGQISEHQVLQKNIAEHREQMLCLDKLGTHIKYFSQKQDVILVKNLLISVQNRWAKCVSRSAERTRDLERGFKDAKQFNDLWTSLLSNVAQNLANLNQDQSIGNQPSKIKTQIAKHKDFHRQIGQLQVDYQFTIKLGHKQIEKCEAENDRAHLQDMLNELKNKWQTICHQSIERQKKLEDALLCSGQFRDALQALFDWLKKAEVNLDESRPLNGDLDCVLYLVEENQKFEHELKYKRHQLDIVHKAANELMASSSEDGDDLENNLCELDTAWNTITILHEKFKQRLDNAFNLAKDFHASIKARLDWMIVSEQNLKFSNFTADSENGIIELIEQHELFIRDLHEQDLQMKETLALGHTILTACVPEAYVNLKHWLAVLQSRWDEISNLSNEKSKRLDDMLKTHRENECLLNDLLRWVQTAETQLNTFDQKQLPTSLDTIEKLIQEHQQFQDEMIQRQPDVDLITKNNSIKFDSDYFYLNSERKKSKSSLKQTQQMSSWKTPEPKMKNPRVKQLFDKWRNVWLLSLNRHTKLKDCLERLKELDRLKNFNFEEWRKRYMNWLKDNRARIMDFFRRQDKDHDGKISRDEFIDGILKSNHPLSRSNFPTTRLELEAVADIFDVDKDGYIDYKEFFATLKPNTQQTQKPNVEKIRDEVQRQVSLCKCSKRYHVLQISDRHYRFGDSQKLRLVRILQSTVMVRVGGGWIALDEFLVKNDPCRVNSIRNSLSSAKGRTNFEIRDPYAMRDSLSQPTSLFNRPRSPTRSTIASSTNNQYKSISSASRSIASSSDKRTPRSSFSQSNEHLLAIAANTRSPSRSGSLGASMSDLSSEAASECSDHLNLTKISSKTSTSSSNQQRKLSQSKLPIPKLKLNP